LEAIQLAGRLHPSNKPTSAPTTSPEQLTSSSSSTPTTSTSSTSSPLKPSPSDRTAHQVTAGSKQVEEDLELSEKKLVDLFFSS
jgi:hypothetical protein